jgi:spermidine synthase
MPAVWRLRLLASLYVLSGAAALVLEVAWFRLLGLYVGHTTGASSTVLASFMGGLSAGALMGGRLAPRLTAAGALRAVAVAEALVGLSALLLPVLLRAAEPALAMVYANGTGEAVFAVGRMLACVAVLALPTMAMGAGYPLLVRALDDDRQGSAAAGWLYAANTCGASAGALLAGFVLIPALGTRVTTWTAAALDLAIAAAAWVTAASLDQPARRRPGAPAATRPTSSSTPAGVSALALVAATTLGFVSLAGQVVWTRVLALIVGPTTYAFSVMVGVSIGGLAVGALVGTRAAAGRHAGGWLGVAALAVGVAMLGATASVDALVLWMARTGAQAASFDAMAWRQLAVAIGLLAPSSLALGAAFPLALAVVRASGAKAAASIYAVNTVGGIAGALAAGFLLVPALGLMTTVQVLAGLAVACGLLVLVRTAPLARVHLTAMALLVVGGVCVARGGWHPALLASGAYRFAPEYADLDMAVMLTAGELLYLREGPSATVAVRRLAGTTSLVIDGKPDASNAGDMLTQKLLGHLPLLMHPHPRRVCVIGLGSGVTAGAVLRHPVTALDVIEIAPEVVAASAFFARENGEALDDRRTRLLVTDARSHLRLSRETYDVVISEPSNPWMAGVAALFTREFLESVRARLGPGGIFCQWAHTYDMSEGDLRSILATFRSVFPSAGVWLVGDADLLIIGGTEAAPDPARVAPALGRLGVLEDLGAVAVTRASDLTGLLVADARGLAVLAGSAPVQDDDRLALEFSAARAMAQREGARNASWLRSQARDDGQPPEVWGSRGRMLIRAEAWPVAYEALDRAVAGGVTDSLTLEAFLRAAAGSGRLGDAARRLEREAGVASRSTVRAARARLHAAGGDVAGALDVLRPGAEPDAILLRAAAGIVADAGDGATLAAIVADLRRVALGDADTAYFAATVPFLTGDVHRALTEALAAAREHPADARVRNLLGATLATLGRLEEAGAAFAEARRLDPTDAGAYLNSARLAEAAGDTRAARRWYAEALAVDSSNEVARHGVAAARRP